MKWFSMVPFPGIRTIIMVCAYLSIMKDEQKMIKSPKFEQILDKQGVKIGEARAASFQPTLLHGLIAVDCEDP